ncbi:hypothetical protein M413DRAFT_225546 [Hebeloma cylindrosporum]|uniref:Isochorismatase-like domain-containing protein n=1 Tax=Hebeloma cylindrosporum TaxID=76867 RepID=A0A0C3CVR3_HEBCY|nr:hypothetical protein M413DRAFT_225546 [Hebeloma cylindrosporum h7]
MKAFISFVQYNPLFPPGSSGLGSSSSSAPRTRTTAHAAAPRVQITANNTATLAAPAAPIHDTLISGMATRPLKVTEPVEYGNETDFWVEYPSGLIDISRKTHLRCITDSGDSEGQQPLGLPPPLLPTQVDVKVDRDRTVRIDKEASAILIIDMQNFFLHPDLRAHPTGLACVEPVMKVVPALRTMVPRSSGCKSVHPSPFTIRCIKYHAQELGPNRPRITDAPALPYPII